MRFRTVFIAVKGSGRVIDFPTPKYNASAVANFAGAKELCLNIPPLLAGKLLPYTTVWDAISDLPKIESGRKNGDFQYGTASQSAFQQKIRLSSDSIRNHACAKLGSVDLERLKHIPQGGSWRDIPFELLPAGLKRARRSDHTKRYGRLHEDGLCSTVLTKCDPHWGSFFHPQQDHVISVREAARIQSLPDNFHFSGNITQQYAQVGNAVPPMMARELGETIYDMIGAEREKTKRLG